MKYEHMIPAKFLSRPNRFIAYASVNGHQVTCHVKNTGRCRELLMPDADIWLQHHPDAAATGRKTEYSLISVYKNTDAGRQLINMDSQAPNQAAAEWLHAMSQSCSGTDTAALTDASTRFGADTRLAAAISKIRREVRYGNSRFDLAFEENGIPAYMEVKGVTLEQDGVARFPDAPTERGIKHLMELEHAAAEGCRAYALFVIAMKGIRTFEPNRATHPEFADALAHAAAHGVRILAYDCIVTPDSLTVDQPVPVLLDV